MERTDVDGTSGACECVGDGAPVALLHGPLSDLAAEELHAQIPGAELVVVPGAGHQVNMEAPERFDAELRPFVSAS